MVCGGQAPPKQKWKTTFILSPTSSPLTLFPSIAVEVEDWSDIRFKQPSSDIHSGDKTGEIIYVPPPPPFPPTSFHLAELLRLMWV